MLTMDSTEREGRTEMLYAQVPYSPIPLSSLSRLGLASLHLPLLESLTSHSLPSFTPSLTSLCSLPLFPSLYLFQGEEEKKTLRSSLVALQAAYEEKERSRLTEISLKQRAEADLTKYKVCCAS
jgi:hypothetical protein